MRILQICHKVPYPPKDGGCIAMNNLTQGLLKAGQQVKILAISTPKHNISLKDLPKDYIKNTNVEIVFIDTAVKPIGALLNLFSKDSYNVSRFYSKKFEKKIIQELSNKEYDIVQLESLFVSTYVPAIRKHSNAKIVLRSHNLEHQIWQRNALSAKSFLKKSYFNFLSRRLKKYELSTINIFDAIVPISKPDAEWYVSNGLKKPMHVIPFGVDGEKINSCKLPAEVDKRSVFHIGAMDWYPNLEGINWFLNNVWGKITEQFPDVKLYLAGRKIDSETLSMKTNVVIEGEVDDAYEFMNSKGLMIIPLLSGGGMRVKLIEGMALGKVIASTSVGAEGVDYSKNNNILIADNEDEFIKAVSEYLNDKKYLSEIGEEAKLLAGSKYSNSAISSELNNFYKELIK